MESIPPTQVYVNTQLATYGIWYLCALLQHVNGALYQASIWATCLQEEVNIPPPDGFGWRKGENSWIPVWMLLPQIPKASRDLLKCGCKAELLCSRRCKCQGAGLPCTALCHCGGKWN